MYCNQAFSETSQLKTNICSICSKEFDSQSGLRLHEKNIHKLFLKESKTLKKCPLCPFYSTAYQQKEILEHFEKKHDIDFKFESHIFASQNEFNIWKNEVEKQNMSFYSKKSCGKIVDNRVAVYNCHRSGFFESKSTNQRRLKTIGSCRINGFCPSSMKVKRTPDGFVDVTYLKTHVGHKKEEKHLPLTNEEQLSIVRQIVSNVPKEKILECIKEPILGKEEIKRIQRVKLKDIDNIAVRYNLSENFKQNSEDSLNFDEQLKQLEKSKDTALLYYKCSGVVVESESSLGEEDFALIYMTYKQKSILVKCVDNTICLDSHYLFSLRGQNFYLLMILAMNETRDGYPVAFMITNRSDEAVWSVFLNEVKQTTGQVSCEVLMTDLGDTAFSTWQQVMGPPAERRVFSSWHLLKDWRENVNRLVTNLEKREVIYNTLQISLSERNEDMFVNIIGSLDYEEDEEAKEFTNYFNTNFLIERNYPSWAHCYKTNAVINETMLCDDLIRSLKFSYLRAKRNQTLDETLCTILKTLRDKLFGFTIDAKLSKLRRKLQIVTINHRNSIKKASNFNILQINPDKGWMVVPSKGNKCCIVRRVRSNCYMCKLQCMRCNTCVHEFICSCKYYAIDNNLCEHIHLIAQYIGVPTELKVKPEDVIECDTVVMDFNDFEDNNTAQNSPVNFPHSEEMETLEINSFQQSSISDTEVQTLGTSCDNFEDSVPSHEAMDACSPFEEFGIIGSSTSNIQKEDITISQNKHEQDIEKDTIKEQDSSVSTVVDEKRQFVEEIRKFLDSNMHIKDEFDRFKNEVKKLMSSRSKEKSLNPNSNQLIENNPEAQSLVENNSKETYKNVVAGNLTLPFQIPTGLPVFLIQLSSNKKVENVVTIKEPTENVVTIKEPTENAVTIKEPIENVVTIKEPIENVVTIKEPIENVVTIKEPTENVVTIKEPIENVLTIKEPTENVVTIKEPTENVVTIKEPIENVVTIKEPIENAVTIKEPIENVVTIKEPTENVGKLAVNKPLHEMISQSPKQTVIHPTSTNSNNSIKSATAAVSNIPARATTKRTLNTPVMTMKKTVRKNHQN